MKGITFSNTGRNIKCNELSRPQVTHINNSRPLEVISSSAKKIGNTPEMVAVQGC
jgi:hypothetical protein